MTKTHFHIDVSWATPPSPGSPDSARLSLRLGDYTLTRLADVNTGALRDYFRASAVTLAMWFADNWWRLRWESLPDGGRPPADWRLRHELTSAPGGTIWPPLMIYASGTRIVLAPVFGANLSQGPVRYLDLDVIHSLDGHEYEEGLDAFFDAVMGACAISQDGTALKTLLGELSEERSDPGLRAWRSLEARLGYDPDEAPDGLIERLSVLEETLGESAVEEAATAAPGAASASTLEKAVEASQASQLTVDLSIAEVVMPKPLNPDVRTWQLGEDAARKVRTRLGLTAGPLSEEAYSDLLSVPWSAVRSASATAQGLPYGARLHTRGSSARAALQTHATVDRRFELARMIGDEIWAKQERFGVISRAKTDRQKFQRAFAQSLLCPLEDVRHHVDMTGPSEAEIRDAARLFKVRPSVIQTLLVNKGILPRETLEDRLEAA